MEFRFVSDRHHDDAQVGGGVHASVSDGVDVRAAMSRGHADIVRGAITSDFRDLFEHKLRELAMPDTWVQRVLRDKQLVVHTGEDGSARQVVQPRIPGLTDEDLADVRVNDAVVVQPTFCSYDRDDPDHDYVACGKLHSGDYLWEDDGVSEPGFYVAPAVLPQDKRERVRAYELYQFFTDLPVVEKFGIDVQLLQLLRRRALINPSVAAAQLQSVIRRAGFSNVTVRVGRFARSRVAAEQALWEAARHTPQPPGGVDAEIVGDSIFLYHPETGRSTYWCIGGSIHQMQPLMNFYRLALAWGLQDTVFMFNYEATIFNFTCTGHDNDPILGAIEYHMADSEGIQEMDTFAAQMTTEQKVRLSAFADRVLPIRMSVDSTVIATAVRITDKHVLVNDHVFAHEFTELIVGEKVAAPIQSLARDLWFAECHGSGESWLLREPLVGEPAVLVYNIGSKIEVSGVVQVTAVTGETVLTTKARQARPGVSGAALVSLDDYALLGIYCGETLMNAVSTNFSASMFSQLIEHEKASYAARSEATSGADGDTVYGRFRSRGLGSLIDGSIRATVPLYDGKVHVGMAVQRGHDLLTVMDPESASENLMTKTSGSLVWDQVADGQYVVGLPSAETGPLLTRRVAPADKVFVIGRDERGPYFSSVVQVRHVGLSAATFTVDKFEGESLPLSGGLVVALSDGAVVGQYVGPRADVRRGSQGFCRAMPLLHRKDLMHELPDVLRNKFPCLHPEAWVKDMLDGVFTHTSFANTDVMLNLASIGNNVLKIVLWKELWANEVPHSQWLEVWKAVQSSARVANVAREFGLVEFIKVGSGVNLSNSVKVHANLLEALIGAVYLNETYEVVDQMCRLLGMLSIDDPGGTDGDSDSTPRRTQFVH